MKLVPLGVSGLQVPAVAVGCMRLCNMTAQEMNRYIKKSLELGANFFDHADIYGGGRSEEIFGRAMALGVKRESVIMQSKCGIRPNYYDSSKEHILRAVEGILRRLKTDYLDLLLIHRPDALVEPEEVAAAFAYLHKTGKVRRFGVSNHRPMQMELLKKYVKQPLEVNQLQFSIPVSNMVAGGLEVNMQTPGSVDHDGSVLDYCRLNDVTIQAWSPFQMPGWKGPFLGAPEYEKLNGVLKELSGAYGVSPTTLAAAWVLRHPAGMQLIAGTTSESRLAQIVAACDVELKRADWYKIYMAAGHPLP